MAERLHQLGLRQQCAALRQLRSLIASPDGAIRRELDLVYAALAASDPTALLL